MKNFLKNIYALFAIWITVISVLLPISSANGSRFERVLEDGIYSFDSLNNPRKLLSLHENSVDVALADDSFFKADQLWRVEWLDSEKAYVFWSMKNSDLALNWSINKDSKNFALKVSNEILAYGLVDNYNFFGFFWEAVKNINGSYSFKNKSKTRINDKYMMLGVDGNLVDNEKKVVVRELNSEAFQSWKLTSLPLHNPCVCVKVSSTHDLISIFNNCPHSIRLETILNSREINTGFSIINTGETVSYTSDEVTSSLDKLEFAWVR